VGLFGTRATASHEVAKVAKFPREMNVQSRNAKAGSHLSAKTFKFGSVEKERVAKGVFGGVKKLKKNNRFCGTLWDSGDSVAQVARVPRK
jgi:hypothetical protein